MSQSAEEIRAEIEATRRELGQDVDALADKVTPSKIVDRQKNKLRGALTSVKERVMGAADDAAVIRQGCRPLAVGHPESRMRVTRSRTRRRATRSPQASSPSVSACSSRP